MSSLESDYFSFPSDWSSSRLIHQLVSSEYRRRRRLNWTTFRPRMERFLYRYFAFDPGDQQSHDRLNDVLLRSRLWLSSPADFNDPFDSKANILTENDPGVKRKKFDQLFRTFEPDLNGLERRKKVDQIMAAKSPSDWHELATTTISRNANQLGVVCFSEDPRNLLMWSHYGRSHCGICFQFETLKDPATFSIAIPVQYTADYPAINFFTYSGDDMTRLMLSKFTDWSYEKEHRIVAIDGAHKWVRFAPAALTGIVIGSRADIDVERSLRSSLLERSKLGLPTVSLYKATQHSSSYRLVIEQKLWQSIKTTPSSPKNDSTIT